jgi:hypothetical protein
MKWCDSKINEKGGAFLLEVFYYFFAPGKHIIQWEMKRSREAN